MAKYFVLLIMVERNFKLQSLPGLHAIVGLNGSLLDLSDEFARYFGYHSCVDFMERSTSASYYDINTKAVELSECFYEQDRVVNDTMSPIRNLGFCEYKDGLRCLMGAKYPIFDGNGNITSISMSYIDMTETQLSAYFTTLKSGGRFSQAVYTLQSSFKEEKLTIRESECLYYLLRGKSARFIAEMLHLSKRTIETHLDNIKYKFNCGSKAELIEKALDLGYFYVIPQSILMTS